MPLSREARRFNRLTASVLKPVARHLVRLVPERGLWMSGALAQAVMPSARRGVGAERRQIDGVPCDVLRPPSGEARRTVLYIHGGGFALHMPEFYRRIGALMADRLAADVLLPDYRLAPKHRYPAAPDDCLRVYMSLLEHGVSPRTLAVIGDSAGGNLALSLLLRLRDIGVPLPACAVAISPATDMTMRGASLQRNRHHDPLVPAEVLPLLARQYVDAELYAHPYASPAYGDFHGLPPLSVYAGASEVLLDDARVVAEAAWRDGVEAQLHVWDEMPHVFPLFQFLPEGRRAMDDILGFVRSHCPA